MLSGAVSPAEPVTGLNMAKAQPLPVRRRLSSGLLGANKSDGRRRKKDIAGLSIKAISTSSYIIHQLSDSVPALWAGAATLIRCVSLGVRCVGVLMFAVDLSLRR